MQNNYSPFVADKILLQRLEVFQSFARDELLSSHISWYAVVRGSRCSLTPFENSNTLAWSFDKDGMAEQMTFLWKIKNELGILLTVMKGPPTY